jgi:hypothetical protein
MMREILRLHDEGKLDSTTERWFLSKPAEELYDVENDPYELRNLATNPKYAKEIAELRDAYESWTKKVGDMSSVEEKEMIKQMWNGQNQAPATAKPELSREKNGVKIACSTTGASIGYRINSGKSKLTHVITTWDYGTVAGRAQNGQPISVEKPWEVYNGGVIALQKGDTIEVNAHRIGFLPAVTNYIP